MGVPAAHGPVHVIAFASLQGKESVTTPSLQITKDKLGDPAGPSQHRRQSVIFVLGWCSVWWLRVEKSTMVNYSWHIPASSKDAVVEIDELLFCSSVYATFFLKRWETSWQYACCVSVRACVCCYFLLSFFPQSASAARRAEGAGLRQKAKACGPQPPKLQPPQPSGVPWNETIETSIKGERHSRASFFESEPNVSFEERDRSHRSGNDSEEARRCCSRVKASS